MDIITGIPWGYHNDIMGTMIDGILMGIHGDITGFCQVIKSTWLVVLTILKNMSSSMGRTQNAKRTFWNACSERRGVFSGFMDPRSVRILFLLPAKRIHSSTWRFSRSFQAVQEQNLQALTCTILLKPGKKRIRLWPAERFLKALKKGSVFGLPSAF